MWTASLDSLAAALERARKSLLARAVRVSRAAPATFAFALSLGVAPLQCGREPEPTRREETAGDALWNLAAEFRAHGDEKAADETLRYLVAKYPSSRFTRAAKERLAGAGDAGP